jgi:hypothetical protein
MKYPPCEFTFFLHGNSTFVTLRALRRSFNAADSHAESPCRIAVRNLALQYRYTLSHFRVYMACSDRLCGLVIRVLAYRSGGPDSIPGTTGKKK